MILRFCPGGEAGCKSVPQLSVRRLTLFGTEHREVQTSKKKRGWGEALSKTVKILVMSNSEKSSSSIITISKVIKQPEV